MGDQLPPWYHQSGFDIRLDWGPAGLLALIEEVGTVVLVDILRFTTSLDVAVAAGALVYPSPWPSGSGLDAVDAEVADGTGPRALSLSPATLTSLTAADRVVLPSANGSHCAVLARGSGTRLVGASLRNVDAVAHGLLQKGSAGTRGPVAVIPCGERWPDGSLRPAVEDFIGAGAVVAALCGADAGLAPSPEAAAAGAAYASAAHDLDGALTESVSGRELRAMGKGDDIGWASALNVSRCVPVLGDDGVFRDEAA